MGVYKPKKLNSDGSLEDIKFPLDSLDGSEDLNFVEVEISDTVSKTATNVITGKGVYNAINNAVSNKQNTLNSNQLAAVNSGITSDLVTTFSNKQNALTPEQLAAVNSGITESLVSTFNQKTTTKVNGTPTDLEFTSDPQTQIGNLLSLATTDKSSLVNAINEVKSSSSGSGGNIDNKLDKTTYEWNKEIAFGGSGYLKIGSFPMYDTNITVEINATTNITYHGTLVVATQNVSETATGIACIEVYDDPTGVIANSIRIVRESGSRNFNIYFIPAAWSKNLIHIQALDLASDASDICIKQDGTAPESTSGLTPVNKLSNIAYKNIDNNFSVSQTIQGNLKAVNVYASSDRRLKENIKDATIDSLDIISKIKIKEYNFIADQTKQKNIGVIAQELKEVLPEDLVGFYIQGKETETDHLSVNDSKLVYLLIDAVQKQQKEITDLKERIAKLEKN